MATHKSAEKRARQSLRKNAINRKTRSKVRTLDRDLRALITKKDKSGAEKMLQEFMSIAAKAAKKSAFHWRSSARRVSRLASQISKIK